MNSVEFRLTREGLGLTGEWIADRLGINPRTVERWEAGSSAIPTFAIEAMIELSARATEEVAHHLEALAGHARPAIVIFDGPEDMPARWQRAVAFRVRQALPEVRVQAGQE